MANSVPLLFSRNSSSVRCSEFLRRNPLSSHKWAQSLRNHNAAVGLLIIFYQRYPGSADRQSASIQRVYEFVFPLALALVADVGSACLERLEIRARGNLAEQLLPRKPDLDIVGLSRRCPDIASAQSNHAVMNAELLQNRLCILG